MIGLALVGAFAILGSSTTESTNAAIDEAIGADFIVTDASFTGFSPVVAENISEVDGIDVVSPVRTAPAEIDGSVTTVAAIDPVTAPEVIKVTMVEGSLQDVADGLLVDEVTAKNAGVAFGDTIEVTFGNGTELTQEIVGVYEGAGLLTGWVMSTQNLADAGIPPRDTFVYATVVDGTDIATVRPAVDQAVADFPNVTVQDQAEYKDDIAGQINQLLAIIYALLGLAVIISILGIVNTLALSVVERTREIGLLRAVGMSRKQLRSSIRWESVVIAVFGALLGIGLGLIFGVSLQRVLVEQGISVLSIPWSLLLVFLVVAALVGVLAALWPARRAARMDVLAAISAE
jgi:putative ABC transport system permease protein